MSQLFKNPNPSDTPSDPEDRDYLGEVTTKFKNDKGELDVQGLAKGKIHADDQITRLEIELAALRRESDQRLTYEELLERIESMKESNPSSQSSQVTQEREERGSENTNGNVDVDSIVDKRIAAIRNAETRQANVSHVERELRKAWGKSYQTELVRAMQDADLSQKDVERMAEETPKALLKLLNTNSTSTQNSNLPVVPNGRVSVPHNPNSNVKNWRYYNNIRKTDPVRYRSLTAEMHREALAQRQSFYD